MTEEEIPDLNLFMVCEKVNSNAFAGLPEPYTVRNVTEADIDTWKKFPFDTPELAAQYEFIMVKYFQDVYVRDTEQFYRNTLFACDSSGKPVSTCASWKAYDSFQAIHWFKTLKSYESLGLGRALLTLVMKRFAQKDYPIYLHTHPIGYRAIKLYSDFGFKLIAGTLPGPRTNDLDESLPYLEKFMSGADFQHLQISEPRNEFIETLRTYAHEEF